VLSTQESLFAIRQDLHRLKHIRSIGLWLDRANKDLPGGQFHCKEHGTSDQFAPWGVIIIPT